MTNAVHVKTMESLRNGIYIRLRSTKQTNQNGHQSQDLYHRMKQVDLQDDSHKMKQMILLLTNFLD